MTRTNCFIKAAKLTGLECKPGQNKYLVMTRRRSENSYLIVDNYTFQQVKDLKYRGTWVEYKSIQ